MFKYVGAGEFYNGIPARDLTEDEFAALTPEQQDLVEGSSLYQVEEPITPATEPEEVE